MDLKAILSAADSDAMFYVCGPDRLIDGAPDHSDTTLSDDDKSKGVMCACVSRAKTASLTRDL